MVFFFACSYPVFRLPVASFCVLLPDEMLKTHSFCGSWWFVPIHLYYGICGTTCCPNFCKYKNINAKINGFWGFPCQSSHWESALSLQGARVQSPARELRSCIPCSTAKKGGKNQWAFGFDTQLFVCFYVNIQENPKPIAASADIIFQNLYVLHFIVKKLRYGKIHW